MNTGNLVRSLIPLKFHEYLFRLSSCRVSDDLKHRYASGLSMWWSLRNLARCGFHPAGVIDAGAFLGDWTREARTIWPKAQYLMIEPQPNKQKRLSALCGESVSLEQSVVGSVDRDGVDFHMDDCGGSSVLEQYQNKCGLSQTLPMKTLDRILSGHALFDGPFLLKADVQGFELELLRGARNTLLHTEAILLELSLLPYNIGAPTFSEMVAFLAERHFPVYDICHLHRRQSDDVAFQVDALFVREDSALRAEKPFFLAAG